MAQDKCPNCGATVEEDMPVAEQVETLNRYIKGFYGYDLNANEDGSDTVECCTGCQIDVVEEAMQGLGAAFTPA